MLRISPSEGKVELAFYEGKTHITDTAVRLEAGKDYSFTYIQEGSVGVFYIEGLCSLTVRIYGASGKPIHFFAENNNVKFSSLRLYTD